MNRYWKEFAFDLISETENKFHTIVKVEINLLETIKKHYQEIIDTLHLKIDFKDYIELNDYITLAEWLEDVNHNIECNENGIFLICEPSI